MASGTNVICEKKDADYVPEALLVSLCSIAAATAYSASAVTASAKNEMAAPKCPATRTLAVCLFSY